MCADCACLVGSAAWATLRKSLRLIQDSVNTANPDDISYVSSGTHTLRPRVNVRHSTVMRSLHSRPVLTPLPLPHPFLRSAGYAPLSVRLLQVAHNPGWSNCADVMRLLPGPTLEFVQRHEPQDLDRILRGLSPTPAVSGCSVETRSGGRILILSGSCVVLRLAGCHRGAATTCGGQEGHACVLHWWHDVHGAGCIEIPLQATRLSLYHHRLYYQDDQRKHLRVFHEPGCAEHVADLSTPGRRRS